MSRLIFETVVYDGRTKEFRIWNITTGSVYSGSFETELEASQAIRAESDRDGYKVIYVPKKIIEDMFESLFKNELL